ncbi:MAG TPA: protein kinase, partial [Kofleriaceae bacterium]|nr:protein kinase [Kofleriaceae bacterium]
LVPTDLGGHLVDVAKVLDFGISKMLNSETVKTQESTLLGTPQYMAPEQATGQHGAIDERTDVFALGAIVYEMLTGTPAFSGENIPAIVFRVVYDQPPPLSQVAPSTPPSVIAAVERALQKRPSDRWPDVNAFIEALTGRALAQRSSSVAATPSVRTGSTASKRIDHGAFANTVDSGSVARPAAKPPRDGIAQAATVASRDGRGPATPSKRRGLLIAMTIAAIAAIVVFTRDAQLPAPADTARARVEADAAIPDALPDAAVAIVDAAPDAAPTKPPPDAKRPTPPTANRNEGDPAVWATLDKAQAEYKNGNYQAAIVHCNSVENASTASPVQHSIALLLRGTIHCKHENNIGLARADLRAIPVAAYRGQLLARCPDLR